MFSVMILNGCMQVNSSIRSVLTTAAAEETIRANPTEDHLSADFELKEKFGTTISEIQGESHFSPFMNQKVEGVHGIVTMIRAEGFYMQSVSHDENSATSEGIFVHQGLVPTVKPGDEVLVNGLVMERVFDGDPINDLTVTHISNPFVEILSKGNPIPLPVLIGEGGWKPPTETIDGITQGRVSSERGLLPAKAGLDFYESLEGMLVMVNNAVVVGATNRYKEIVVLPDHGKWASVRTPRGGIVVQKHDFNPERVILDDALVALPFVQIGDYATAPIIGVMDYTFGNYKLLPIKEVQFKPGGLQPSGTLDAIKPGQIRVASYNVEMLSPQEPSRIAALADQIVGIMGSPDILGLQEIADNDGWLDTQIVSADRTYQSLIDAIFNLGGPRYEYTEVEPMSNQDGGAPGANIRVGILYRVDRGLSLVDAPHGDATTAVSLFDDGGKATLSHNPGRIQPEHNAFRNSRKPLVAEFLLDGEPLYVINAHLISKGGDSSLFGAIQPPLLNSEERRNQQAQVIQNFVASLLMINPNSRLIVLGDLNDFQFSVPLKLIKGNQLYNLVETLPAEEQYTYVYDGNSQVLDHILVSEALFKNAASVDILHVNSEFDYTRQFSDHEPVVASFWWESGAE